MNPIGMLWALAILAMWSIFSGLAIIAFRLWDDWWRDR